MPTPAPSSHPLKLTSVSAVEAFLAGTPFASRSIADLTGGYVNYVYRIHLLIPFDGSQTVVLKHAQPFWKIPIGQCGAWEVERQVFEVEAMTRVRLGLPKNLLVKVPKIHHFDVYNNLIVMEDCGADVVTIRELLCSGSACSISIAETIGTAVGDFVALVHEWSRSNPDGILDIFDKCLQVKKMTAEFNYTRLVATLQCSDRDDLPLLSDFKTDPSDIQAISKLADEYHSHLMSARFLMGDLWYENILVSTDQHQLRLYILDWEFARTALPGSELGLFCASMDLLGRRSQLASELAPVILRSFLDAYSRTSNRDARLAQDTLAHWGMNCIFWTPRDPPGDRELVQGFVGKGVEFLVHSRDKGFLEKSPVQGLLPR
ncbi:kinase-like domain-containing protein [Boletus coccyginus]|nr:kinase-like domain-containing protein [Boletus coccyginus]